MTTRTKDACTSTRRAAVSPELEFLDPSQFASLAISRRKLIRADETGAGLRGLLDLETGKHYLVEAGLLARFDIEERGRSWLGFAYRLLIRSS